MSAINEINKIIFIENLVCVFRNYTFVNLKSKYFIKIYIFLVLCIHFYASTLFWQIASIVLNKWSQDTMNSYSFILYILFSTTNTLLAIIMGFCNSKSFKTYIECINAIHKLCSGDEEYRIAVNRFKRRVYILATAATATVIAITTTYLLEFSRFASDFDTIHYTIYGIIDIFLQYRYIVENFTYVILLEVVVTHLQYLRISISTATQELRNGRNMIDQSKILIVRHGLDKWEVATRHLSESSDQLSSCFSLQIAVMLFTATVYYILLLYKSVCFIMQRKESTMSISAHSVVTLLSEYLLVKLAVVRAGQRVRDAADALDAALASLRYLLIDSLVPEAGECGRRVGILARRLRAAPVRARLPARALQMSLLVVVLTTTADYTLILLQFNRVV